MNQRVESFEGAATRVGNFQHARDDISRQYMRRKGAEQGPLTGHVYYIVRQGLPGFDGEMPEGAPSGISIVPSSNVCGGQSERLLPNLHVHLFGNGYVCEHLCKYANSDWIIRMHAAHTFLRGTAVRHSRDIAMVLRNDFE